MQHGSKTPVTINSGLRTTRAAIQNQHMTIQSSPAASYFDPKAGIHKPHNSLAHVAKMKVAQGNLKSFADLRIKLGDKRNGSIDDKESLPSELSDDEWVEIVKF